MSNEAIDLINGKIINYYCNPETGMYENIVYISNSQFEDLKKLLPDEDLKNFRTIKYYDRMIEEQTLAALNRKPLPHKWISFKQ